MLMLYDIHVILLTVDCLIDSSFCFFFKQMTAYELRISYWSSDVCSSDLMADSAVGQMFIPGIGMSNPIDLSPMFASAHNGLEEMARQFQESGEKSSKAMVDMVNNSLHALNELQSAISSGGILGILSAGFNAFGSVSQ